MPRSKDPNAYPFYFREAMQSLQDQPESIIRWPASTEKEARALRLDFYAFRAAALKHDWNRATAFPILGGISSRIEAIAGRWYVILFCMDHTPEALERSEANRNMVKQR